MRAQLRVRIVGMRKVGRLESSPRPMCNEVPVLLKQADLAKDYLKRFDVDLIMMNRFTLLNEDHEVDLTRWCVEGCSRLWSFNLHYFEYAVALGARYRRTADRCYWEKFVELVLTWIGSNRYAEGDAWEPYTTSLRLVNWLVCRQLFASELRADPDFDASMTASMYLQYRHLQRNRETHLLANHYWENIKTLLIVAKFFGDEREATRAWNELRIELEEQILPDGVHYERSLMYHKLVLEGLLRVMQVLRQTDGDVPQICLRKAQLMLDAASSLEKGMGKTPFFNDAADGVAKECAQLIDVCSDEFGLTPRDIASFPHAGYYKLYDGDMAVILDAGAPGPYYMLGHAHCDALSFEMSCRGTPIIVNSGTYAYQSSLRPYFRSTQAHNTVNVRSEEQMQCWAAHRVGRRMRYAGASIISPNMITARMENQFGSVLERTVSLHEECLYVEDRGPVGAALESYIHLAPGESDECVLSDARRRTRPFWYSPEFGLVDRSRVVVLETVAGELNYTVRGPRRDV